MTDCYQLLSQIHSISDVAGLSSTIVTKRSMLDATGKETLKMSDIKRHKIKESAQVYKPEKLDSYMFKVNYGNTRIRCSNE